VSPDSSTGEVTLYYGGPSGAVSNDEVLSANANVTGVELGVITNPVGVLPDTVTLLPGISSDPGGYGGASCTNTTVAVTYTAKIKAARISGGATPGTYTYLSTNSPKTTAPANISDIFDAIASGLGLYLLSTGIGGLDQTAGAGVVYTADLPGVIRDAWGGLYDPIVTTPGTSTTAIALGHIATAGTINGTLTVV
jgi:hypothetical protein